MGFIDIVRDKKRGDFVSPQEEKETEGNVKRLPKSNYEPQPRPEKKSMPSRAAQFVSKLAQAGGQSKHEADKFITLNAENPRTAPRNVSPELDSAIGGSLWMSNTEDTPVARALREGNRGRGKSGIERAIGGGFGSSSKGHPALTSFGSLDIGGSKRKARSRR